MQYVHRETMCACVELHSKRNHRIHEHHVNPSAYGKNRRKHPTSNNARVIPRAAASPVSQLLKSKTLVQNVLVRTNVFILKVFLVCHLDYI